MCGSSRNELITRFRLPPSAYRLCRALFAAFGTPLRASLLGTSLPAASFFRPGGPLRVTGQRLLERFDFLLDLLAAVAGFKEDIVRVGAGFVPGASDAFQSSRLGLLVLLQVFYQQGVGLGAEII